MPLVNSLPAGNFVSSAAASRVASATRLRRSGGQIQSDLGYWARVRALASTPPRTSALGPYVVARGSTREVLAGAVSCRA